MTETPPVRPLIQAAMRFRAQLTALDNQAALRLIRAYGAAYQRLAGDIDALAKVIASMPEPTWGQIQRLALYQSLQEQIRDQVGRFAVVAENEIRQAAADAIGKGLSDSGALVQMALPGIPAATLKGTMVTLNPDAVATMIGFLQQDSPLYQNLSEMGPAVADAVADALRTGVVLGYNPVKVAAMFRQAAGRGLTWALTTARTANLWAYRVASHANYRANSHVVSGWYWFAELGDPRTCMSCVSQHGSLHTNDEVLSDHHAGRCTPIPATLSYAELGYSAPDERPQIERGEDWFKRLPADQQRQRMGAAMYKAWKAGEVNFSQLSTPYTSPVYGEMFREASLKGLLGERAKLYYGR